MIRGFNLVLLAISALALTGVYMLKYSAGETASEKAALEGTIARQEASLSLLKADWASLNQPAHIAPIIIRHAEALGLGPAEQSQFGSIEDLPMRPAAPDNAALDALFASLEAGIDPGNAAIGGARP